LPAAQAKVLLISFVDGIILKNGQAFIADSVPVQSIIAVSIIIF